MDRNIHTFGNIRRISDFANAKWEREISYNSYKASINVEEMGFDFTIPVMDNVSTKTSVIYATI